MRSPEALEQQSGMSEQNMSRGSIAEWAAVPRVSFVFVQLVFGM